MLNILCIVLSSRESYFHGLHTVSYVTAFRTALFIPRDGFFVLDFGVGGGVGSRSSGNESSEPDCCCEFVGLQPKQPDLESRHTVTSMKGTMDTEGTARNSRNSWSLYAR